VAGADYPATFQQFDKWFATEAACVEFLAKVRWPDGFVCPKCGTASKPWPTAKELMMCSSCGRQASVRAGIFHRSRLPLKMWFSAMWFVCAQKTGVSALSLYDQFGFGSYETAWAWLHKLRRAMVIPGRDLLGGPGVSVEIDQTFIGGRTRGRSGQRYHNKVEVVIAVEVSTRSASGASVWPRSTHPTVPRTCTSSSAPTSPTDRSWSPTAMASTPPSPPSCSSSTLRSTCPS
jgi:hypothetical protein